MIGLVQALGCARLRKNFQNFLLHVQHPVHIGLDLAQAQRQPAEPGCDR